MKVKLRFILMWAFILVGSVLSGTLISHDPIIALLIDVLVIFLAVYFSIYWNNRIKERFKKEFEYKALVEQQYKTLFDQAENGIFVLDKNGNIENVNLSGYKLLGFTKEEMIGESFKSFIFLEKHKFENTLSSVASGISVSQECKMQFKNNAFIETETIASPLLDGRIQLILHDLSNIRKTEKKFKLVLEAAPDATIIANDKGLIQIINNQVQVLFGYNSKEILNKPVEILIPQRYHDNHVSHRDNYIKAPTTRPMGQDLKLFGIRKDQSEFPVEISLSPLITDDESLIIISIRDVTKQKSIEDEIKQVNQNLEKLVLERTNELQASNLSLKEEILKSTKSEEELNYFFSQSLELLCIAGTDGYFKKLNPMWSECLGYSDAELLNKPFIEFIHKDDIEKTNNEASLIAEGKNTISFENRYKHKNGKYIWLQWSASFNSLTNSLYATARDITDQKDYEEKLKDLNLELNNAKVKAEESDRLKSSFLATMSHELRTPLNSIIGFTGILKKELPGTLNPEQKKQIGMVSNSAKHLLKLINDVLDISKIEAGQLQVSKDYFSVNESIENVKEIIMPMAEKKDLRLEMEIESELPKIKNDKLRYEQVLINLVNNAVKFTHRGYVKIICESKNNSIITSVVDTGIGIEEDKQKAVIKPFYQIEKGLARKFEGTGLGLAISKKLITLMNGEISFKSKLGYGSTFTFSLKIKETLN